MITLENLSVDIDRTRVVDSVSLQVPDGAMVGLLGPNGCGKSTLLRAIYRARKPSGGRIMIDDEDLLGLPAREAARRVAVVSQDSTIEFDATVTEIVMVGRTPHQRGMARDTQSDRHAVLEALDRVGCADFADRSVHALSGGERQRVLIARALAQGCTHLVLDEPTNHLDVRYQIEVLEIVSGLGVAVLAALHDLSLAGLFCDQVHLMTAGSILAGGDPGEVITRDNVRAAYGADVLVLPHPEHGTPHILARRSDSRQFDSTPTEGTTR